MRDPNFFCLCPVFVVNPVVLMYKKVLRPFSTSRGMGSGHEPPHQRGDGSEVGGP